MGERNRAAASAAKLAAEHSHVAKTVERNTGPASSREPPRRSHKSPDGKVDTAHAPLIAAGCHARSPLHARSFGKVYYKKKKIPKLKPCVRVFLPRIMTVMHFTRTHHAYICCFFLKIQQTTMQCVHVCSGNTHLLRDINSARTHVHVYGASVSMPSITVNSLLHFNVGNSCPNAQKALHPRCKRGLLRS